jgi:hypothetical protein
MIATINLQGELHIHAESELEGYALNQWFEKNQNELRDMNIVFHSNPKIDTEFIKLIQNNKEKAPAENEQN